MSLQSFEVAKLFFEIRNPPNWGVEGAEEYAESEGESRSFTEVKNGLAGLRSSRQTKLSWSEWTKAAPALKTRMIVHKAEESLSCWSGGTIATETKIKQPRIVAKNLGVRWSGLSWRTQRV